MKKRLLSLLIVFAMVLAFVPAVALADEPAVTTATVDFTSQLGGGFLHAPQTGTEVASNLAESYGYTDSVDGVSALDVLVKAHELVFGEEFTAETAGEYLAISKGSPTKQFGVSPTEDYTMYGGFFHNHGFANDGTMYDQNNYNGTTVGTQKIEDGDYVEFFFYESEYYGDTYSWFLDSEGEYSRSYTVEAGEELDLVLKGFYAMSASIFPDAETMALSDRAQDIDGAQIYTVNMETGALTPIEGAVSDEGDVTLSFDEAGTYVITACIEDEEFFPTVLTLTTITVTEAAVEPAEDADVYVSISEKGGFVTAKTGEAVAYQKVTVSDRNKDGKLDIDEALYAAHEEFYEGGAAAGYSSEESQWGLSLAKLWGDSSRNFGYQVNSGTVSVMGLDQELKKDDHLEAYIYASAYPDNEAYAIFDKVTAEATAGIPLELTLKEAGFDDDWNMVFNPCQGAEIRIDGELQGIMTDAEGKAKVSFKKEGTYTVSAKKTKEVNGRVVTAITAPVCVVTVTEPVITVVKTDFTAQAAGAFLCAPQFGVEVSSDLAESYGFADKVSEGVSALDVLVKAHEVIFGEEFTAEGAADYLKVERSMVKTVFGEKTDGFSFTLDGEYPHDPDGEYDEQYGFTGYSIDEAPVTDGSGLEFFLYRDEDYYMDYYSYFMQDGERVLDITAAAGADIDLKVEGYMYAYGGYLTPEDRITQGAWAEIEDAQIAWVDMDTGELTDIDGAVTDEDGEATIKAPDEGGVYYLTALVTEEAIEDYYASPNVMTLLKVTVIVPAEDADIYVSISDKGSFVTAKSGEAVAYRQVTVSDRNLSGTLDIDDALYAAHEEFYEGGAAAGYSSAESQWGLSLAKLWGDSSWNFGYQVNSGTVSVMDLSQELEKGDHLEAYIIASDYPDNEPYAIFDKVTAEVTAGTPLELTLKEAGFDDNWNMVFNPCQGAVLTIDGEAQEATTDADGKATLTFAAAGTYVVSAEKTKTAGGNEVTAITAPVCIVTVTEAPNNIPTLAQGVSATATAKIPADGEYSVDLSTIFADADGDELTYTVSVNGADPVAAAEDYSYTADGAATLVFKANDGKADSEDTYTVTLTVNGKPYISNASNKIKTGTAEVGTAYSFTISMFTDPDRDSMTYEVSIDGGDYIEAARAYKYTPTQEGTVVLVFRAYDGMDYSDDTCTLTLTVASNLTPITVPSDATLFVGEKNFSGYNFMRFDEMTPESSEADEEAGTTTYYFSLGKTTTKAYLIRVSGEGYVTYADLFTKTAGYSRSITPADLKPEGKTSSTVDHDVSSLNGYNVGDIYLNINEQGYLKLAEPGDTYQIVNLRNWEAVDTVTSNNFVEPDYHYAVIDENGAASDSVITVSDGGVITAVGEGTAIVLVTYDAMTYPSGAGGPFFGAIWPENTGVFVVSVGAGDSGISTGMTVNEGLNTDATAQKMALDALDAELDVIYFIGENGEYTFTPDEGCAVSVANPTVGEKLSFSGFEAVEANDDGSFTVPLAEGRNIVKIEKGGKAEYQVITAKQVTVTINNGEAVQPGDQVSIVFSTLYHPANKLAGVYNMNAIAVYSDVDAYDDQLVGGASTQYNFASNAATQTVNGVVQQTTGAWGMVSFSKTGALIVPDDYEYDTFKLSGGYIIACGYGDPFGNHRGITYENGKAPNLNAAVKIGYMGVLPDIEIPIQATTAEIESIELDTEDVRTDYFAGEAFDDTGLVVRAIYSDGTEQTATNYTIEPEVLTEDTEYVTVTYRGKTATIEVSVTVDRVVSIAVTADPAKTSYTEGETFDPTGMVVTATYESGKTAPVTQYSYSPQRELELNDNEIVVSYTGEDAAENVEAVRIQISVSEATGEEPETITVRFTLLGDDQHDSDADGQVHTLKAGNLVTWIERTNITVSKDSYVIDVIAKALSLAGIPYENPEGNYIVSVRGLAALSNGQNSGWMYTLNGKYPTNGVSEQIVKNGDVIVFHYTDDYTKEDTGMGGGSDEPAVTPGTTTPKPRFIDVPDDAYYAPAVYWAVEKGITTGTTETTFSPDENCTRAQMVTFLWRAAGSPAAKTAEMPFTDVESDAYYYQAVLWAVENGITKGTSDTTFSPNNTVTRGQTATFLYRFAGSPAAEKTNVFTDVDAGSYYADAVGWAYAEGITTGTGETTFSPENSCTRAQIVTFLYRYFDGK